MRRLGSSLRPAAGTARCGSWTSGRGAARSRSRWPSRCGGSTRSTRSRSLAVDISPDALDLARENAVGHAVADRITFAVADLLPDGREPAFDLVLANLPYVRHDAMAGLPVATSFEPALALDGGPDGLAVIGRLLGRLPGDAGGRWRGAARDRCGPGRGDRGAGRRATAGLGVRGRAPTWPGCRAVARIDPRRPESPARSA